MGKRYSQADTRLFTFLLRLIAAKPKEPKWKKTSANSTPSPDKK